MLNPILDYVTKNCYDEGHGLDPYSDFVINAMDLLECLRELSGMSEEEMHHAFDDARVRVHGPNVKGGR